MNKYLISIFILISINLFSYDTYPDSPKMCDEYGHFYVNKYAFPSLWQNKIVEISQSAANYWNEAGSEHYLYYAGVSDSNIEIDWDDPFGPSNTATAETFYLVGWDFDEMQYCISTNTATIEINPYVWNSSDKRTSHDMMRTITHEFGHVLGLNHSSAYSEIVLMYEYYSDYKHLTEDDKYGVRSLYGKDDRSLKISKSLLNSFELDNPTIRYYNSNNDYDSYSQPQIVLQPNKNTTNRNYDYIITWVKSNTREINYKFVNECSDTSNNFCTPTGATNLGQRHWINGSITLTAPSIAINDSGTHAIVAWKQESSNTLERNLDDIHVATIYDYEYDEAGNTHGYRIFNNENKSLSTYIGKTTSKPVVVWVPVWNRFVIFYTQFKGFGMWEVKYIVSNSYYQFDGDSTTIKSLGVSSNWNPFSIDCNQPDNGCLFVYNSIKNDTIASNGNIITSGNISKLDFEILLPNLTPNPNYNSTYTFTKVSDSNIQKQQIDLYNYGHYSIASKPTNYSNIRQNIITFMPKAAKQEINICTIEVEKSGSTWYITSSGQFEYGNSDSNGSRTGHSVIWNSRISKYRHIWIEE